MSIGFLTSDALEGRPLEESALRATAEALLTHSRLEAYLSALDGK